MADWTSFRCLWSLASDDDHDDVIIFMSLVLTAKEYPLICAKSMRFKKSFDPHALFNYQ